MNKILYFTVLYFIIGLACANPGFSISSIFGFFKPHNRTEASICLNNATAQSYLSKALALINTLQANLTTNAVLQLELPNFVSYLKNTTNQALLSTNCTSFVINLKAAQLTDKAAERAREKIDCYIEQQFQQAARNATGINVRNELDFDDDDEGH